MASIMIRDNMSRLSDGIQAITPEQAQIAKKNHIPTFRGVLYEKDEFGNLMFVNSNTVVLGGSINALEKLCGTMATFRPQSLTMQYKDSLTIASSIGTYNDEWESQHENESIIALFGVGTGGSGTDISQVYKPDFKQRTLNTLKDEATSSYGNWIPFRVSPQQTLDSPGVLSGEENKTERAKYHFRMKLTGETDNYYGWFLKNFENCEFGEENPLTGYKTGCKITSLWKNAPDLSKDGTEIKSGDDLLVGPEGVGIESFAEFTLRIGPDDVRSFFVDTGSAETPRFNTLGLFSGIPVVLDDGYVEYYNVRLFSVVNFENVAKRLRNDAIYVYRVYSAL